MISNFNNIPIGNVRKWVPSFYGFIMKIMRFIMKTCKFI